MTDVIGVYLNQRLESLTQSQLDSHCRNLCQLWELWGRPEIDDCNKKFRAEYERCVKERARRGEQMSLFA